MAVLAAAILSLLPRTGRAQLTRDVQLHLLGTESRERFMGAGLGYAIRPPGRIRFGVGATVGAVEGRAAVRAEGVMAFHLNPGRESGVSPYAAAGVATNTTRSATRGYVLVLLGVEQRPGRRSGWFVEAGVGGGLRLAAGYRLRTGSGIRR